MKKVLIISEYIAPVQGVGAVRWTKLGKYLAKNENCEITVLTDEKDFEQSSPVGNWQAKDDTLNADIKWFSHYLTVPNSPFMREYYKRKNQKIARQKKANAQNQGQKYIQSMETPKEASFLKRSVLDVFHYTKDIAAAAQALKFIKSQPWDYDVIISTYGPAWPHLVASKLKKLHPNTIWLADYRDACWMPKKAAILSGYYKGFAKKHSKLADKIIVISKELPRQLFLEGDPRCVAITNGFDPDEAGSKEPYKTKKFTLSYTGVIYGVGQLQYSISTVFKAFKQLEREGVLSAQTAEICYAGGDTVRFLEQATSENALDYANPLGVIPRAKAIELQQQSCGLLLSAFNTQDVQGYITSKFFEYMLADKPIIATITGNVANSLTKRMINEGELGICYEQACHEEDFVALVSFIKNAYLCWQEKGYVENHQNKEYVQKCSHPYLAKEVANLF